MQICPWYLIVTEEEPSVFVLNEDVDMATWLTTGFTEISAALTTLGCI